MIVDESQHLNKKYVNIQIGLLSKPSEIFLVMCRIKKTVNSDTIMEMIYAVLCEYELDINFMSLLISDAARYMLKAGYELQKQQDKIFHVTCFVHLLHNCVLKIRNHFKNIDFLISSVKFSLLKSVDRREKFQDIPLPPQPILTRWGSWLESCEYYYNYLPQVNEIINTFENDGIIIENVKEAFKNNSLTKDLIYIHENYRFLFDLINIIENKNFSISDTIEAFYSINLKNDIAGIFLYIKKRFEKNQFLQIKNFEKRSITPKIYNELLLCPSTSISIERSFSMLGKLVTKERNFIDTNIEKYMILYCNSFQS